MGTTRGGPTPKRNIRVGQVWDDADAIARARGETMTQAVTRLLERYVARHRGELETGNGRSAEAIKDGEAPHSGA